MTGPEQGSGGHWSPGAPRGEQSFSVLLAIADNPPPLCVRACVCECVCARSGEGAGRVRGTWRGSRGLAGLQIHRSATSEPRLQGSASTRRPEQPPRTSAPPSPAGTATEGPTPLQTQSLEDYKVKLTRDNKSTDPRTRARSARGRWCPLTPRGRVPGMVRGGDSGTEHRCCRPTPTAPRRKGNRRSVDLQMMPARR